MPSKDTAGAVHPYFNYQRTTTSVTFWPQVRNTTYVWRVRAKSGASYGPWSSDASFTWP